jgi:hypothetical protein
MGLVTAANTLSIIFIANGGNVTPTSEEEWSGIVFKAEEPTPTDATI